MDRKVYLVLCYSLSALLIVSIRSVPLEKIKRYVKTYGDYSNYEYDPRTSDYLKIPSELRTEPPDKKSQFIDLQTLSRVRRALPITPSPMEEERLVVTGLRFETADREPTFEEDGTPSLLVGDEITLRLFGSGFSNNTQVAVTTESGPRNSACQYPSKDTFQIVAHTISDSTAQVKLKLPASALSGTLFYLCYKTADDKSWKHVGDEDEPWLRVRAFRKLLPLWLGVCIIVGLLVLSGLFSGLNLGLMALDRTELKILVNTGTDKERRYARAIEPVRSHGNYLLCSLLLGNVLVNSTLTILMDDLTSGPIAVFGSTIAIVIFGEIVPQAICSRHGLAVGARTVWVTKFFMMITFPLSYPISLLLDKLLGKEIGNYYNRERLKELIKVTNEYNDLEKEEVNIISGALEMREKTVADVMTKLEDAFMLAEDAVLDFETLSEIREQGYSRIPVYKNRNRHEISTILYTKDLAFVDSRLNMPVSSFVKFHPRETNLIFGDTKLDVMLKMFREGNKGHMAFVTRVNSDGDGDPFYEVIGLVTLEDIIEEMIKAEIVDETDVWTDNRTKRRRNRGNYDLSVFLGKREKQKYYLSPQLTLAAFQYLTTSVIPFSPDILSLLALRKLLEEDVNRHVKLKAKGVDPSEPLPELTLYEKGKAADYFVLILEGLVEVSIGNEDLQFTGRPFTSFGKEFFMEVSESPMVVTPPTQPDPQPLQFFPDYTVKAKTEVTYLRIPVSLYIAAVRFTKMEKLKEVGCTEEMDITKYLICSKDDPIASPASELASNQDLQSSTSNGPVTPVITNATSEPVESTQAGPSISSSTPPSPTESEGLLPTSTRF